MMRQFPFNRKFGIALISVLLIAVVVSMLAVSLLSITRSSKFAHLQQENWARSMDACYSGLDFAKSRLVADKGWGTTTFTGVGNLNTPDLVVSENGSQVTGQQGPLNQSFQIEVANNLAGYASSPSPAWSKSKIEIPPHTVLVRVTGMSGAAKKSIEVLLARASFSQTSVFAGKDLYFDTQQTVLRSTLPKANRAKAKGNIYLNDPSKFDFAPGNPGRLQAGTDAVVNTTGAAVDTNSDVILPLPATSQSLIANSGLIGPTSADIHGLIELNVPTTPPVFNKSKLASPTSPTIVLPAGEYKFTGPNQVVYSDGVNPPPPNPIPIVDKIQIAGKDAVLLKDYQFKPQGNIKVDGDLKIQAQVDQKEPVLDAGGNPTLDVNGNPIMQTTQIYPPATLAMGYNDVGFPETVTPSENRLEVKGDLKVEGDLAGSGQIVVNKIDAVKGGTFTVEGPSHMSATRTTGMAITTERRVSISDVSPRAALEPFAMHQTDIDAFKQLNIPIGPPGSTGNTFDNLVAADKTSLIHLAGPDDEPNIGTVRGTSLSNYNNGVLPELVTMPLSTSSTTLPGHKPLGADFALIKTFIDDATTTGKMTIGKHLRLREFLKSVERGAPESYLINATDNGNPASIPPRPGYNSPEANLLIQAAAVNQVLALNQDARARGKNLRAHLASSTDANYAEDLRNHTVYGGLLHSQGSVELRAGGGLSFLGILLSSLGSIHIGVPPGEDTRITFDPSAFEDNLDMSATGFTTLLFWSND